MYKKCTSNSYTYTKYVQIVQNLYKVQNKNNLKLEMFVFLYIQRMYKLYKTYKIAN